MENPSEVEKLITALEDKNPDVRQHAARALGRLSGDRSVEPLIAALGSKYWSIDRIVDDTLRRSSSGLNVYLKQRVAGLEIADATLLGHLCSSLTDVLREKLDTAEAVAEALGNIADARAVVPLVATKEDTVVKQIAAKSLKRLIATLEEHLDIFLSRYWENRNVIERVVTIDLTSQIDEVGEAATEAVNKLMEISLSQAVSSLIAALYDSDLRNVASRLLIQIGEPAIESLIGVRGDRDAQKAARKIRDSICIPNEKKFHRRWKTYLCKEHLTYFNFHKVHLLPAKTVGNGYYACRICKRADNYYEPVSEVVAVLDSGMIEEQEFDDDVLKVNWLLRRSLFDFDRVEINQATDEEIERFAIQVGNDTDSYRQERYPKMHCVVSCELSANTIRISSRLFGQVDNVFKGGRQS